jgi:iron(III) transport system permease protein
MKAKNRRVSRLKRIGASGWRGSLPWSQIVWVIVAVLITYLVAGPVLMLLFSSVRDTTQKLPLEKTDFTLKNYVRVLTATSTYKLAINTLIYALGALALSFSLTVVFAWFIERSNIPLRSLLLMGILAPIAFPGVVEAMAWILLANPSNGIYNFLLRKLFGWSGQGPLNIYSMPGMILVTGLRLVPSMYLMISGTFSRLDPSLEEASEISGVLPRRTFWHISMPLLRPSLLAAIIYYFVLAIEIFEIPGMLGMPRGVFVFSTALYNAVDSVLGLPDYGLACGYGIIGFTAGTVMIILYARAVRRREQFTVITGKGYRPRLIRLGRWRYLISAGMLTYIVFALVIPILALIWASLLPFYSVPSMQALSQISFSNYLRVVQTPAIIQSAVNTVIVAVVTPTVVIILATIVAWRSVRFTSWTSTFPDRLSFVLVGTPSVVIGLALMFLYLSVPIPIYGTLWIIIVAFVTRFISFSTRLMGAAFMQIHRELEEASSISGVTWWKTMWRVTLPLVWPSVLRGWLWVCVHSVREVTLALMLVGIGNSTIAVRLWMMVASSKSDMSFACALAILIVAVLSILTFLIGALTIFHGEVEGAKTVQKA